MKNLVFLIFIFILSINIYAKPDYFSANGRIYIEVDSENYNVKNIFNDMMNKNKIIDEVEAGFYINKNYYKLKDYVNKIEYINGSNIIKITAVKDKVTFVYNIYTPFDANKDSFFIVTDILTEELDKSISVKLVYNLKSDRKGNVYWNKWSKNYTFDKVNIKAIINNSEIYSGNKTEPYLNLKMDKNKSNVWKAETYNVNLVSNIGKIENYDEKREIFMLSFSPIDREFVNNLPGHYIINQELNNWNYWHNQSNGKFDYKKDVKLLQNITMLKMMQLESGSILSKVSPNGNNINIEDMLFAAYAFVKAGQIKEAEKIFNYIIKYDDTIEILKNIDYIGPGAYCKFIPENKLNYNLGLFLYVLSEYFNEVGNIEFFKKNYVLIYQNALEYLYKNNMDVKKDIIEDNLKSFYYIHKGLGSFLDSVAVSMPDEIHSEYNKILINIKKELPYIDEIEAENIIIADKNFMENKNIEYIFEKYLKKSIEHTNFPLDNDKFSKLKTENILESGITLFNMGKNEYGFKIIKSIDDIIQKNDNFLPDSIEMRDNKIIYENKEINAKTISKYIILKRVGEINGADK